ncbi:MAG: branched-chain amino acid ABC transporter substrate-binding protein [Acidimicrobiales bacterium]
MKRPVRSPLLVLVVLALVLAACGGDGGSGDEDATGGKTVTLAFVGALTGDNANLGINARDGAKLAVEDANRAAGADGVKIVLKEFDTQGDPAQATTLKDRFINDASVIGVVGPVFSGETKAVLPALQEAGLVMISPSATNVALPTVVPNQTVFHRIIPDDGEQGIGLSQYISKKLAAKTAAYVDDNSEYGKGLTADTRKLLEAAGVRTAVSDTVDPKAQDFSAAVNKVKSANASLVFYGGYFAEAGRFKKQLADAGVKSQFISGDGSLDPGFIAAAGAASAEGAQITCPCKLATADAPGRLGEFARAYQASIGRAPGTYSSEGYDAVSIFAKGVQAGATSRKAMLDFVERPDSYEGIAKTVSFAPNGNVTVSGVFVYEVKAGKLAVLGSTEELLK